MPEGQPGQAVNFIKIRIRGLLAVESFPARAQVETQIRLQDLVQTKIGVILFLG
jgi:hypothetical protein